MKYSSLCITIAAVVVFFLNATAQKNIEFRSNVPYNAKLNDVWGYADTSGEEYAIVGLQNGMSIVQVTDPDHPEKLFFIPGRQSVWRDIKTWNHYAYIVNEEDSGLLVVDLQFLPDSIHYHRWTADTLQYATAHNIYIDEQGYAYLFGSNLYNQGAAIFDLNEDAFEPPLIGLYDNRYVHDGFVRGDTLWAAEIIDGEFSVIDMSDKENPVVLATQPTPDLKTHNCWLSDDGHYLVTTDEVAGAPVAMYDVSDLSNIEETDQFRTHPDDSVIPHNAFFLGDYLWISYYREGVVLVDAHQKNNLVEVGYFDTSPLSASSGFQGNWGVYPYLPSGNILASDIEEGLFILSPTYTRAAYLEGIITDSLTNVSIHKTKVEIVGADHWKYSNNDGTYTIGVADSGLYTVRFSHPHCETVIVSGVELNTTETTILDVETNCQFPVSISEQTHSTSIQLWPNPFLEKFYVKYELPKDSHNAFFSLIHLGGKAIEQIPLNTNKGHIIFQQELPEGLYIAQILNDSNVFFSKIIVKQ